MAELILIAGRRVKRQSKGKRKKILGEKFIGDCPCAEGNLYLRKRHDNKLFVGCDCYPRCKYAYSVPELDITQYPRYAEMSEIERAKVAIVTAPRCLNCGAPMTRRTGKYGQFLCCTVKGCGYSEKLPHDEDPAVKTLDENYGHS